MRIDSIWGRSLRTISARTDFIIPMAIAMEHHIPVLPIAVESGLEEYFAVEMNRIHDGYGDIRLLRSEVTDRTEISYYQKLVRDLGAILLENEEVERIKQAFGGKKS